jgi:hypothetical protein
MLSTPFLAPYVVSEEYHSLSKRGEQARKLIAHQLELAKEQGKHKEFRPLAAKLLRRAFLTTVYRGFKADSGIALKRFRESFPLHWRLGTYLLTVLPACHGQIVVNSIRIETKTSMPQTLVERCYWP